jgi:hypothetical protein
MLFEICFIAMQIIPYYHNFILLWQIAFKYAFSRQVALVRNNNMS